MANAKFTTGLGVQHIRAKRKRNHRGLPTWFALCGELPNILEMRDPAMIQDIACATSVRICDECRRRSDKFCACGYSLAAEGVGYRNESIWAWVCKKCGDSHTPIIGVKPDIRKAA